MEITRREFLRAAGSAAAAAGVAALPWSAAEGRISEADHADRLGVLVDTTLCIGLNCRRCEIACARENHLPPLHKPPDDESVFSEVRRMSTEQFTVVNRFTNPLSRDGQPVYAKKQCMHCEEPACASACFVKALRKTREGPVVYDASLCVGCRYCMVACPFDVPAYEYNEPLRPRVRKCAMCWNTRTSKGLPPACVEACPNEVMTFGPRSELLKVGYERVGAYPDRYQPTVFGEYVVGGTSWLYLLPLPPEQMGFRRDLGNTPLPEYTRNYLSAAPLVMAMWPVFFGGIYLFTRRREELMQEELRRSHADEAAPGEKRRRDDGPART